MNESTLTQLKVIVERAVRPVRASFARKRKVRQELLAHVSGVFEEELARLGDERLAVERTGERFGPAAELTQQLQAAVPASDAIDRFFSGQPDESTLRAAIRLASWNLALAVLVFVLATALSGLMTTWTKEAIQLTAFSVLLLPTYMFALTFATEWVRQASFEPARRSRLRVALLISAWFAFSLALFEGPTWLSGTRPEGGDTIDRIWLTLWLAASIPWMPWCLARVVDARIRQHREWASLPID